MPIRNLLKPVVLMPPLLLSLVGCATTHRNYEPPLLDIPEPPSIITPLPQESYSQSAAADIQNWRQKLMGTLPM